MPLFRSSRRTGPAFMLQNGPFSPKTRQIAFFKVNTGVSLPSCTPPLRRHGRHKNGVLAGGVGFGDDKKKNHSLHDATRNGPVLSPISR